MKKIGLFLVCLISAVISTGASTAIAQEGRTEGNALDCKEYGVDYEQQGGLTQEEIRDRMDRALFDSLNKYDECLQQSQSDGGGASGSANGGSGSGTEGTEAATSTASSGIQGTEATNTTEKAAAAQSSIPATSTTEAPEDKQSAEQKQAEILPNGKIPDDIPPSDNDTVLQQKVKEAAMNEPDPEKRAKLWNEYRKLKGLSQI